MEQYRLLSPGEREYLLEVCKNDPNRKIIHIFFNIWKCMFLLSLVGAISLVIDSVVNKTYADLMGLMAIPVAFLCFWMFPNFILKKVDSKHTSLKNNNVYIRRAEMLSLRHQRERMSSSSRHYKDVYFASVYSEDGTHSYEVLAHNCLCNIPEGSMISVLRFDGPDANSTVNREYAMPYDFTRNPNIMGISL